MSGILEPEIQFFQGFYFSEPPLLFVKTRNIARLLCLLLALLCMPSLMDAQISNTRKKTVFPSDSIFLDSLRVLPGTMQISLPNGDLLSDWKLDSTGTYLLFLDSTIQDSLIIEYRVFPFAIPPSYANKDLSIMNRKGGGSIKTYVIGSSERSNSLFNDSGIQKSGNISRGIAFGNAQNLSVNSSLNLQLSGRITERYSILASVSDDNIPIQPNGNTQQLQDFDQVFIQVFDDKTKLIAGDFILRKPEGYFMNYFKRAQGAYFLTEIPKENSGKKWTIESSVSVSKGRFARNVIQGVEGNQGPYRLTGADGETFIIVLAGTESVYIDGKLLQRGQDKDYVIDYNSSEITFTPKQFITKDRRIVVEFQYSDKRYARPLIHTALTYGDAKSSTYLNIFSESDSKNQPLQQDVTDEQRRIMTFAGDDIFNAVTTGVDSIGYSSSQVLYAMVDSLGFDSVFRYSNEQAVAFYRVQFTSVGSGNGDYKEDGFTANGKKYKWISPEVIDGELVHYGSYVPLILLSTPKKKQMLVLGHKHRWGKANSVPVNLIYGEGALSNNDLNTFSSIDSENDVGYAFRGGFEIEEWHPRQYLKDKDSYLNRPVFFLHGKYEYTSIDFSQIERFREVEFDRNWNLLNQSFKSDLNWATITAGYRKPKFGNLSGGLDVLRIGTGYNGYRGNLNSNINTGKWIAIVNGSLLSTQGNTSTSFLRHKATISRSIKKVKISFIDEHELNQFYASSSDSLASTSYQFYDWQVAVGTVDSVTTGISVYYRDRMDWKPFGGVLAHAARAEQYGLLFNKKMANENRLSLNISNRKLRVVDPELFTGQPENTLIGRIEYYYRSKKGWFSGSTFYEIGSGLEQKREFIYFEVPAGQGVYVWNDYNGDGVKDLNEFEVAQFSYEANYIRTFIQTTDYVRTFTNQFSQSFQIQKGKDWKDSNVLKKWLGRFSDQVSYKIDRKTGREEDSQRFNPFLTDVADSVLISMNGSFRNILFFNKANPKFGLNYVVQQMTTKNLLSNGFESRSDFYHQIGLRWNFYGDLNLATEQSFGTKEVTSDFLAGRNYEIDYVTVEPKITWQNGVASRFSLVGEYGTKENRVGVEKAEILKYGAEASVNTPGKGIVQGGLNFYSIKYNGAENSSLSFDMLEGLNAGFNSTWTVSIQRTVANNLQLTLSYFGRKPEGVSTIHSGGMQMKAFF
jgi:hypothetical protein